MKTAEKHIGNLLVAVAIFLVFGNVALAGEAFSFKENATVISEIQQKDHGKPFIFNEVSIGEVSQIVSQNEYISFGVYGAFSSNPNFLYARVSSLYNSSYLLNDKRELIFRHLFPFHFFW